ncbi:MAG TPA: PhzF family phenazine biosynthesis protein [Egibacteraceae bacterium]|nr:PhzF family phenazine biosynthesis protein [Egibacteraceae bacterium]
MPTLSVLRVFVGPDGAGGNPLGVFLEGAEIPEEDRQAIAADLGFSETVFLDDPATGRLRIYTPAAELPFAGHPLVGTAWLLAEHGTWVDALRPPAGTVATWEDDGRRWIRGRPEWAPEMTLRRYESPAEVDALEAPPAGTDVLHAWAWEDETAGRVRARFFAARLGVPEDEATGAAAVRLGAVLGRPLVIRQGTGSELRTRPGPAGTVEVGGVVEDVETRAYP